MFDSDTVAIVSSPRTFREALRVSEAGEVIHRVHVIGTDNNGLGKLDTSARSAKEARELEKAEGC